MIEVGTTQSAESATPAPSPLTGDAPAFLIGPRPGLRLSGRRLVILGGLLLACGFFVKIDGCIGSPFAFVSEEWGDSVRNIRQSGLSWLPVWHLTEITRVGLAPFAIGLLLAVAAITRRRPGQAVNRIASSVMILYATWVVSATLLLSLPLPFLEQPAVEWGLFASTPQSDQSDGIWGLFDNGVLVRILLAVVFPLLLIIYAVRSRRRPAEFELGLTLFFALYQFAWWLLFQITEARTWKAPWECGAVWNFISAGLIAIGASCELLGASGSIHAAGRALLHGLTDNSGGLLCPECQYDLRGSSGTRCPECGAAIAAALPTAS
jgi:hypothetical protein